MRRVGVEDCHALILNVPFINFHNIALGNQKETDHHNPPPNVTSQPSGLSILSLITPDDLHAYSFSPFTRRRGVARLHITLSITLGSFQNPRNAPFAFPCQPPPARLQSTI
jgi:hypothetical protein